MNYFSKQILFFVIVLLCFTNTQCEDDEHPLLDCDLSVLIDENYYNTLESDNFTFLLIQIEQDCLAIDVSASGCSGNSWEYKLVDSGNVAESFPEQRYLKFELINNEDCLAVFNRFITFDLLPIRVEGSNEIILNIEGYEEQITYSY